MRNGANRWKSDSIANAASSLRRIKWDQRMTHVAQSLQVAIRSICYTTYCSVPCEIRWAISSYTKRSFLSFPCNSCPYVYYYCDYCGCECGCGVISGKGKCVRCEAGSIMRHRNKWTASRTCTPYRSTYTAVAASMLDDMFVDETNGATASTSFIALVVPEMLFVRVWCQMNKSVNLCVLVLLFLFYDFFRLYV